MVNSGGFIGKVFSALSKAASEEKDKTDRELPFAVMIFTLMAASGISPYDSWKRMRKLTFLPTFTQEADEVVRQVEVLGKDPLTVMQMRAETTGSKLYRNFLGGFVSSIRSGGKIVDYMKSQLKAIFELRYINLNRSIERIATLVEAYSVMLIVVLCSYILFVVLSSSSVLSLVIGSSASISPLLSYLIAFVIMPVGSCIFILMAHNLRQSAFPNLKDIYRKALLVIPPVLAIIALIAIVPELSEAIRPLDLPAITTICLAVASMPFAFQYWRISKINYNGEESLPSFIRDVTEAQKTGLSPEKSIIEATKRKDYGHFSKFLNFMRSQIEWGIPLRKTFDNISKQIRSWFVTINFSMMVETIEIGGNSTQSLEILSEYSEKERELQVNRRELLKPYVLLAFMWSGLIAVTTTIVALTTKLTTSMMTTVNNINIGSAVSIPMSDQLNMFSVGIIIQCWISGFFIGKIGEGNMGAGFKHAALLAITAYVSLVVSQIVLSSLFRGMFGT